MSTRPNAATAAHNYTLFEDWDQLQEDKHKMAEVASAIRTIEAKMISVSDPKSTSAGYGYIPMNKDGVDDGQHHRISITAVWGSMHAVGGVPTYHVRMDSMDCLSFWLETYVVFAVDTMYMRRITGRCAASAAVREHSFTLNVFNKQDGNSKLYIEGSSPSCLCLFSLAVPAAVEKGLMIA